MTAANVPAPAPATPSAPKPRPTLGPAQRGVLITAAVLCLIGAGLDVWAYHSIPPVFPTATVLAVLLQVPLLLFGWWLLRLARPVIAPARRWSAAAVVWGATAACGCAVLANEGLIGLWGKTAGVEFASDWSASFTAPLNEELLKLAGVALLALAAPRVIRGPVDGMVFGALVGLGFQVTENVAYSLNDILLSGATNPGAAVALTAAIRVGLTSPGSHWAMTAVAGAGVGYLAARGPRRGTLPALGCLAVAMGMHLVFDAPGPGALILLKVLLDLVVVLAFYITLRMGYRARAKAALARLVEVGLVPAVEAPFLLSRGGRRRRRRRFPAGPVRADVRARQLADVADVEQEMAD